MDHVLDVGTLPNGEGKQAAKHSRFGGGGNAATAAVAISRLGGRATWRGFVGDDLAGAIVTRMLQELGVEVAEGSVVAGAATPISSVLVDDEGRRWLGSYAGEGLGTKRCEAPQLPPMGSVDAIAADYTYVDLAAEALRGGRERGIPRVLDIEHGMREGVKDLARLANHVVFSAHGLASFTGIADWEVALRAARAGTGAPTVGVTRGPQGSVWLTDEGLSSVQAPQVHAKDTTGCGDVFHGAYALALAEGRSVVGAAQFASTVAALKAERGEAWLGMPTRGEVELALDKGLEGAGYRTMAPSTGCGTT